MLQSTGSLNQSRGFSFEQLEMQLATLEILLDVAERHAPHGAAAIQRVRREHAKVSEHFLAQAGEFERRLVEDRVNEIEERVARLPEVG